MNKSILISFQPESGQNDYVISQATVSSERMHLRAGPSLVHDPDKEITAYEAQSADGISYSGFYRYASEDSSSRAHEFVLKKCERDDIQAFLTANQASGSAFRMLEQMPAGSRFFVGNYRQSPRTKGRMGLLLLPDEEPLDGGAKGSSQSDS